jgi:Immunity protein 35
LSIPRVAWVQDDDMTSKGVLSEHHARALAEALLDQGAPWVIVEVREYPVGWVFTWDLQRNLEATKIGDKVPGCAPILVDRSDGSVHFTGTARSIEEYVDRYERRDPSNDQSWAP